MSCRAGEGIVKKVLSDYFGENKERLYYIYGEPRQRAYSLQIYRKIPILTTYTEPLGYIGIVFCGLLKMVC
jgi:hypothetical protein